MEFSPPLNSNRLENDLRVGYASRLPFFSACLSFWGEFFFLFPPFIMNERAMNNRFICWMSVIYKYPKWIFLQPLTHEIKDVRIMWLLCWFQISKETKCVRRKTIKPVSRNENVHKFVHLRPRTKTIFYLKCLPFGWGSVNRMMSFLSRTLSFSALNECLFILIINNMKALLSSESD